MGVISSITSRASQESGIRNVYVLNKGPVG